MPKYKCSLDFLSNLLEPSHMIIIMKDVFRALEHLHSVGYVHNDLKKNNIMFDNDMNVHIIDLGFATNLYTSQKEHIQPSSQKYFRGNLLSSSL